MPAEHVITDIVTDSAALTDIIVQFINNIGIPCRQAVLETGTFLPGIDIKEGAILYDPELMKYPGDLLHEAGHVAVLQPEDRLQAQSPDKLFGHMDKGAAEMAAIAWSWAALQHLGLEPEIVFHEHGYKGDGTSFIKNFNDGKYFGVPTLDYIGMCRDPKRHNDEHTFPNMLHWLRPKK